MSGKLVASPELSILLASYVVQGKKSHHHIYSDLHKIFFIFIVITFVLIDFDFVF
jgi:hypothetical protein